MNKRVHVIGAGLAGLSASLELAQRGVRVVLSEMTGQAGCLLYTSDAADE